jgi:hypothetical protein
MFHLQSALSGLRKGAPKWLQRLRSALQWCPPHPPDRAVRSLGPGLQPGGLDGAATAPSARLVRANGSRWPKGAEARVGSATGWRSRPRFSRRGGCVDEGLVPTLTPGPVDAVDLRELWVGCSPAGWRARLTGVGRVGARLTRNPLISGSLNDAADRSLLLVEIFQPVVGTDRAGVFGYACALVRAGEREVECPGARSPHQRRPGGAPSAPISSMPCAAARTSELPTARCTVEARWARERREAGCDTSGEVRLLA